jgi:hypothetical protein
MLLAGELIALGHETVVVSIDDTSDILMFLCYDGTIQSLWDEGRIVFVSHNTNSYLCVLKRKFASCLVFRLFPRPRLLQTFRNDRHSCLSPT